MANDRERRACRLAHGTLADHGYKTGFRLAPMLLRNEKDIEIRPERAAHISQKEIDGIERERMKAFRLGYSDSHKIPMVSVMTVRSAPTRK